MEAPLLEVSGLTAELETGHGKVLALDGVSLSVRAGQTLCVVGESGCGKSLTALSILRLLPEPPLRLASGQVRYRGRDLLNLPLDELRALRGNRISMIFQEPMTSLNPVYPVGEQIAEGVRLHQGKSRAEAWARAVEMLRQVGIPAPEERARQYPHQLSGGMRQRVMIAIALACDPEVLIADEPTTALDVTIQAQILELLARLQRERNMAVVLITHDLGIVAERADEVAVMYAGKVVERAPAKDLFAAPQHPYTQGLLRSVPSLAARPRQPGEKRARLPTIPGVVPAPWAWPSGCRFRDRCPRATEECARAFPPTVELRPGHSAACYHPGEGA